MDMNRDERPTRLVWSAEKGWHETQDVYRLVMTETGAVRWVRDLDGGDAL